MPLEGSLPPKKSFTSCWILGIRVDPPTSTISSMSFLFMSASSRTFCTGFSVDLNRSMLSSSNLALLDEVVHDPLIEVLTSQMSISIGGNYLKYTIVDGKKGHVEGTAAQIEHQDVLLPIFLVQTVGNGGSITCVLGGLSLSIVEVSRDCDNSMSDLLAKISFCSLLHLPEDHSGDFFRSKYLGTLAGLHLDVWFAVLLNDLEGEQFDVMLDGGVGEFSTDQTLGVENGVFGVGGQLVLGCISNQTLAICCEGYIGGGDSVTLVVCYDLHSTVLVYTNTEIIIGIMIIIGI
nr:unnamed protein product [Callosobruchus chinensis]